MSRLPVVLLALTALAACSAPEVDTPDVERVITKQLSRQAPTLVRVSCPEGIEWRQGEDFHCIARDVDGSTRRVTVSLEGKEGGFTWTVD